MSVLHSNEKDHSKEKRVGAFFNAYSFWAQSRRPLFLSRRLVSAVTKNKTETKEKFFFFFFEVAAFSSPDEGNQALQEFLNSLNPRQQHSTALESYLIKPIQRILKYPLLLQQLKNVAPTNSEEQQVSE